MSIPIGGEIGLESHPDTDQFIRLETGDGRVLMGPAKDQMTFDEKVSDGWCVRKPLSSAELTQSIANLVRQDVEGGS